ncbi:MAG: cupin domain-containing protein [Isosphaeraceae bacterium]
MMSGSGGSNQEDDLRRVVEGRDGISVIRGGDNCRAWNNIQYRVGLSARNVGSSKLSMNVATIPPGGVAYAHIHVDFELMLYILQGRVRHEFGPGLRLSVENQAGDFIYIEPGVPHEVFNLSESEPVVAVVARSDASEWENIIPYDRNQATSEGAQPSEQHPNG